MTSYFEDETARLKDWKTVIWFGEQVARRGFGMLEPYYRDYLDTIMSFPVTRGLVAESLVAASEINRNVNVTPRIDRELEFDIDEEADCVGPRYVPFPVEWISYETTDTTGLPQLIDLVPDARAPGGLLQKSNIMVRKEHGARQPVLCVTLVGLHDTIDRSGNERLNRREAFKRENARASRAALSNVAIRRVAYRYSLVFEDYRPGIPLTATVLGPSKPPRRQPI